MSGLHADLVTHSSAFLDGAQKDACAKLLSAILDCQYVSCPTAPDKVWKVTVGAGMGLPCSGEVADAAYYNQVERDSVSQDSFREWHDIVAYIRYRDDILLVHSGSRAQLDALIGRLQELSTVFKLEVESIASDEVQMLDVVFYRGPRWRSAGIMDHRIHIKRSSLWIPLSDRSMHPAGVHRAWPLAHALRVRRLCSERQHADSEIKKFCSILRQHSSHIALLPRILGVRPPIFRIPGTTVHRQQPFHSIVMPYCS